MMIRLQVTLNNEEAEVLSAMAAEQLRDPRDQLRFLLRQYIEERGLLPQEHGQNLPQEAIQ